MRRWGPSGFLLHFRASEGPARETGALVLPLMSVSFARPPVHEVVMAVHFDPEITHLRNQHVGLFWHSIRADFPQALQRPPLGSPAAAAMKPDEQSAMPRFWFLSADGTDLIQIQRNAFIFNWRRREDPYPRFFRRVRPSFDKWFGRFHRFVREDLDAPSPLITRCELSYVNVVRQGECGWDGPSDTARILPSFSPLRPRFSDDVSGFQCQYAYGKHGDVELQVSARSGTRTEPPHDLLLVFELRALGMLKPDDKFETNAWFLAAHEALVACFLAVTASDVQQRDWLLREGPE